METDDIPRTGIDFIDRTHQEEVGLYNDLRALVAQPDDGRGYANDIEQALERWIEHTVAHFERENALMASTALPTMLLHEGEHVMALKLMEQVLDHWRSRQDTERLIYFLNELWPDWFVRHVGSMDQLAAQHALQQGYREP